MLKQVKRTEKIIQFGEGGFLRGFVDWIVQLTNEASDFDASAVIVQPIEKGLCARLEEQGCVYTHVMRGIKDGETVVEKKIIDVVSRTVEPYKNFADYLALAKNPDFRFIVSNTTESGIAFDASDKPENAPSVTFPAKVALLLKERFDLGLRGFIFLPCELIDKNGSFLKKYIIDYARLWGYGEEFVLWVENENIFCNTLVDRIVTGFPKDEKIELGYEDNMLNTSELFHLWVIETDYELTKEFPFDKAGLNVIVTKDLEMYRTRKVRILNGAHTSMIPYAMLEGVETVGECMENEKMLSHVMACVYDEIIPTLDLPVSELKDYADNVFLRFRNPYIKHLCASIALNSVSKFKVRVLPSILEYEKRFGRLPEHLMLAFAKLIAFYRTDMTNDDAKICEFMKSADVRDILGRVDLWGEDLTRFTETIENLLK